MGDERLRELERRWTETQAPEDEAAYLLSSVRAGSVSSTQLELWAYCGRLGAALALGDAATGSPPSSPERWVSGLARWGRRPCAAAAVATLPLVWPMLAMEPQLERLILGDHPAPAVRQANMTTARALAEEWLRTPTLAQRVRVDAAAQEVRYASTPHANHPQVAVRHVHAYRALKAALDTIVGDGFAGRGADCLRSASEIVAPEALGDAMRLAVGALVL